MTRLRERFFIKSFLIVFFVFSSVSFAETPHLKTQIEDASFDVKDFFFIPLYGTLLGSIIGTATLSFETYPTNHLNRIAQGASIGLYAGIIFSIYSYYREVSNSKEIEEKRRQYELSYKSIWSIQDQNSSLFIKRAPLSLPMHISIYNYSSLVFKSEKLL